MPQTPRKVTSVPQGYVKEIRDGREVYVKKTATVAPPTRTSNPVKKTVSTAAKPAVKAPTVRRTPPSQQFTEDVVYVEPTPTVTPTPTNQPLYEGLRTDRKLQTSIHPNIAYYKYPDPNAGYSKAIDKYFDINTGKEIDPSKSLSTGSYNPYFLNTETVNEGSNLGTVKQNVPRITNTPDTTIILNNEKIDKSGTKGLSTGVGDVGFSKGGKVKAPKLKGYVVGGKVNAYYSNVNEDDKVLSDSTSGLSSLSNGDGKGNKVGNVAGKIGSSMGWLAPVMQAQQSVRSSIKKDELIDPTTGQVYQKPTNKQGAIAEEIAQPYHEKYFNDIKKGEYRGIGAQLLGGPLGQIAYNKFIGEKEKAKEEQANLDMVKANVLRANTVDKQAQLLAARNAGDLDYRAKDLYNINDIKYNSQYKKGGTVKAPKMQKCADGGKIVGKGTAKSDSITAKIEDGAFIVPAKNAKVAEVLREKVLLKAPKTKAPLNDKGGVNVKLSNGEHKFSKEEKEELIEKGIDVNKLAPDSEHKEHIMFPNILMKYGGELSAHKAKIMLKEGMVNDKPLTDKQKGYFGNVAGGNNYFADGGTIDWSKVYGPKKTGKTYKELITPPNTFKGTKENWKKAVDDAIAKGKITPSDRSKTVTKTTVKTTPNESFANKTTKAEYKPEDDITVPVTETPVDDTVSAENAKKLADSAFAADKTMNPELAKTTKKRKYEIPSNFDPTLLAGVGQTALGLRMLKGEKRPIDQSIIDAQYNANVERAQREAKFGFTPEQRFLMEQEQQNALNDARFSARNFGGGNASTAFNQERQAINQGLAAKMGMKVADQDLRMAKQQYADQQVANRAELRDKLKRRQFGDAMQAFQEKQQAGSELIGAGLANTIGAYRYNKELQEQQRRNDLDWSRNFSGNM